jgi:hypothetical protein
MIFSNVIALNEDLSKVNIQVQSNTSTNEIDVNEIHETFESDINDIFDKHVPIKEMSTRFFLRNRFHGFPELSLFTATGASFLEIIIFRFSF